MSLLKWKEWDEGLGELAAVAVGALQQRLVLRSGTGRRVVLRFNTAFLRKHLKGNTVIAYNMHG